MNSFSRIARALERIADVLEKRNQPISLKVNGTDDPEAVSKTVVRKLRAELGKEHQ